MKIIVFVCLCCLSSVLRAVSPIEGLLERIDKGASRKFCIEQLEETTDFFELDQEGDKVVIRGNNYVSIATGLNWYLKYYAGIHLSWNNMTAKLPEVLPAVSRKERHETTLPYRYYLNYCTYSYSMAFWDWPRWEREIDWMALHGINLPLAIVGTDVVWYNVLSELGYAKDEINEFIAGPAFQAWWLMNNLEGWGGPNPDGWYKQREALQKQILERMREYGIHPVLPGYAGMVPHDAGKRFGVNVSDSGLWCGFRRPAFLQPTDPGFTEAATLYYRELTRLYGTADFYSMDPFHEGGNAEGIDWGVAGQAIRAAMKQVNPEAVWVIQAWQANPRQSLMESLPAGDLLVLDLAAESCPQWGDPTSLWYREEGFGQHDWVYCMLLNYGGNVGLHGKMEHLMESFYRARSSSFGQTLKGVGLTMEGIENNPVMYELLCELPWRAEAPGKDEWLEDYLTARYGKADADVREAWHLLGNSIYNCPPENTQQGTHESVFCARPGEQVFQVSSWSGRQDYYDPEEVIRAAGILLSAASRFKGNDNFEYDLVDVVRQAVAEKGRQVYSVLSRACQTKDKEAFVAASRRFLDLILGQDRLLATRSEFRLGRWIRQARCLGTTPEERDLYEWNARVQITTWGDRAAANNGGLHDYAHKEWNGLLRDFYYPRWQAWIDWQIARMDGISVEEIDFYALEEPWTQQTNPYPAEAEGDVVETAREVYNAMAGW